MDNPDVSSMDDTGRPNIRNIFLVFAGIAILAAGIGFGVTQRGGNTTENNKSVQNTKPALKLSKNTLVYGVWQGGEAVIQAQDLDSGDRYTLATLPENSKHIRVLDKDHLVFIGDTDQYDRGRSLAVYTISTNTAQAIYTADPDKGIDDYALSPNKQYIATWEAANGPSGQLADGKSAVYTMRMSDQGAKNQIYSQEGNSIPFYYPRAVTNNGNVYMDSFVPNVGTGWAKGMARSDFFGTRKEVMSNMAIGTYSTQPEASPDGRYLAFGGYDPRFDPTPGDPIIRSIIRPNTVDLLDMQTGQRTSLANLSPSNMYPSVSWDQTTGKLLYNVLSTTTTTPSGLYSYDVKRLAASPIPTGKNEDASYLATLENGKQLSGTLDAAGENIIGNLGATYSPPAQAFTAVDVKGGEISIPTQDTMMQYITITPSNYFTKSVTSTASVQATDEKTEAKGEIPSNCGGQNNLQMCPFYFKTQLASTRLEQQANRTSVALTGDTWNGLPRCRDLAAEQCGEQEKSTDESAAGKLKNLVGKSVHINTCLDQLKSEGKDARCFDSPLYLYGTTWTEVKVTIGTPIHNTVPQHINNGYDVTLGENGVMYINGGPFDSIAYDYTPALKRIPDPEKGTVVAKKDLPNTLRIYAKKLGLNGKETEDLVSYGIKQVISPYAFISFFDQDTSQKILPITFTPRPDNYRNVVFFIRLLKDQPPFSVPEPEFPEPLNRSGFTAVEVSGIVR